MTRTEIATLARAFIGLYGRAGVPISHAVMLGLASLPGSDWRLIDGAALDALAQEADAQQRAHPENWTA